MRSFRNILLLAAIALTLTAASMDEDHDGDTALTQNHAEHHTHSAHLHAYTPHDFIALHDMRAYTSEHFGAGEPIADGFGVTDGWDGEWVYRQVHFLLTDGTTVRVCHATDRHDPSVRWATAWDHHHERYARWQQIH